MSAEELSLSRRILLKKFGHGAALTTAALGSAATGAGLFIDVLRLAGKLREKGAEVPSDAALSEAIEQGDVGPLQLLLKMGQEAGLIAPDAPPSRDR